MAITHLGSGIWSYSRRRTGAILRLTRPATIIRSLWRGEARISSMPKRDRSLLGMTVLIISMAQQAKPNSMGHMAPVRPQLIAVSSVVVTTPILPSFCSRPMTSLHHSRRGRSGRGVQPRQLRPGPVLNAPTGTTLLFPLERALFPDPDIAHQQDRDKDHHLD